MKHYNWKLIGRVSLRSILFNLYKLQTSYIDNLDQSIYYLLQVVLVEYAAECLIPDHRQFDGLQ